MNAIPSPRKRPLSRDTVLAAAVALADRAGIEQVSMRNLARDLGVVPMALYKHVANKEELLDAMVESVIAEISAGPVSARFGDWRTTLRARVLFARQVMLAHPWASAVFASRTRPTTAVLDYLNVVSGELLAAGLSAALVHQALHALGSRLWGFHVEVFPSPPPPQDPAERAATLGAMAAAYPALLIVAGAGSHARETIVGTGCDDEAEFEWGLDLMLAGIAAHRDSKASGGG